MEAVAKLEEDARGKFDNRGQSLRDSINSIYGKEAAGDRGELINHKDLPILKEKVSQLVEVNRMRVLPRARELKAQQILPCGEVGWSQNGQSRIIEHNTMTVKSPLIFRVANCVLRHIFPSKGFRMHQSVVFEIVREDEAAIGESIASHLNAAYIKHGGFNFEQAGVSTSKVWSAHMNWQSVASLAFRLGYFAKFEANLQEWQNNQKQRKAEVEFSQYQEAQRDTQSAMLVLQSNIQDIDIQQVQIMRQLDQIKQLREQLESKARRDQEVEKALEGFASGLGVL